jgi:hypothetical protein
MPRPCGLKIDKQCNRPGRKAIIPEKKAKKRSENARNASVLNQNARCRKNYRVEKRNEPNRPIRVRFRAFIRIEREHLLVVARHSHIGIDSRTESREAGTAESRGLGASLCSENATSETTGCDAVGEVVLGAETFDAALSAGVESTDHTEVLSRGPGAGSHILETGTHLLAPGEIGNGAALGCEG